MLVGQGCRHGQVAWYAVLMRRLLGLGRRYCLAAACFHVQLPVAFMWVSMVKDSTGADNGDDVLAVQTLLLSTCTTCSILSSTALHASSRGRQAPDWLAANYQKHGAGLSLEVHKSGLAHCRLPEVRAGIILLKNAFQY